MVKTTKQILISLLFSILLLPMFTIGIYATNTLPTGTITTVPITTNGYETLDDNILPKATIDDAKAWSTRKGNDVVGLLQTIIQPLSVTMFIVCGIITMFGVFGQRGVAMKGIIGMGITVVVYTGALFAPELLMFFSGWLAS